MVSEKMRMRPSFCILDLMWTESSLMFCGIHGEHIGQFAGNGLKNDLSRLSLGHQIPIIPKGLGGHVGGFI